MFDWDDLRLFLAVARAGRMAAAARTLRVDPTTVGRRLQRLESQLGGSLFESIGGERKLTERGHALIGHAEAAESAALAALGEVGGEGSRPSGQVRLSAPEGFATWLLTPTLDRFHRRYPDIRLDLVTASGFATLSRPEADVMVMLARPRVGRVMAAKLGDYRLRLYGAADYLDRAGTPTDAESLRQHSLIGYVPEFLFSPELDYLGEIATGLEPSMRSTSINIQHQLIAEGTGIGVLPAFIGDRDPRLTALLADTVEIRRAFWLVTHSEVRRLARIRAVADWLGDCAAGLV